jgi:hypothetical protein
VLQTALGSMLVRQSVGWGATGVLAASPGVNARHARLDGKAAQQHTRVRNRAGQSRLTHLMKQLACCDLTAKPVAGRQPKQWQAVAGSHGSSRQ